MFLGELIFFGEIYYPLDSKWTYIENTHRRRSFLLQLINVIL